MRFTGVVLVIIGLVALISGGLSNNRQPTLIDVGGLKAAPTGHKTPRAGPLVGSMVLIGGLALLVVPRRRLG